jgi:hypothetical protein
MLMTSEEAKAAGAAERRTATRLPASSVASITSVRISPVGSEATLVNISSTGVLVRCVTRLLPGTPVTVVFDGSFTPSSVKGKVVRCMVADICKPAGLAYHIGIAFNSAIALQEPSASPAETAAQAAPVQAAAPILVNRW